MKQSKNKFKRYLFKIANQRIVILGLKRKKQKLLIKLFQSAIYPRNDATKGMPDYMAKFQLALLKFCDDYMMNFSPRWKISLGTKYVCENKIIVHVEARFSAWAEIPVPDYMVFFQIFQIICPGWILIYAIANLISNEFVSEAGLKFQPA